MNLSQEILKVVDRYAAHVEKVVRERAKGMLATRPSVRQVARKPIAKASARGVRHCKVPGCGKRGHDARNCPKLKKAA